MIETLLVMLFGGMMLFFALLLFAAFPRLVLAIIIGLVTGSFWIGLLALIVMWLLL
jgi:hypothetical protein